jgi:hypothetical protein
MKFERGYKSVPKDEPTDRQVDYAEKIAATLNLDLPEDFSKYAYSEFISEWEDDYIDAVGITPQDMFR